MPLDLSPEVERMVRERAALEGVSVDDLLSRAFSSVPHRTKPEERVRALLAQWRAETGMDSVTTSQEPGAPSNDLFRRWQQVDAEMSAEEREAEDCLWEEVERGLDETREQLGMRRLSA